MALALSVVMNTTPAVSNAPIIIDPAQAGGAVSADSAKPSAGGRVFADALNDASAKPVRKPGAGKGHDAGSAGGQLPLAGKLSPPSPPPAMLVPSAPAGASAAAAAALSAADVVDGAAAKGTMQGAISGAAPKAVVLAETLAATAATSGTNATSATAATSGTNAMSGAAATSATAATSAAAAASAAAVTSAAAAASDSATSGRAAVAQGFAAARAAESAIAGGPPKSALGANGRDGAEVDAAAQRAGAAAGALAAQAGGDSTQATNTTTPQGTMNATQGLAAAISGAATTAAKGPSDAANGVSAVRSVDASRVRGSAATDATDKPLAGATTAATSTADTTPSNSVPPTDGDATAQTVDAAAMAAAAPGIAAANGAGFAGAMNPSAEAADAAAASAADGEASANVGPNAAQVALAVSMPRAAAASVAALHAQSLSAANAPDRHTRGDGEFSLTPAADGAGVGDGAAGLAQVSTVSSAADTTPAPTLKVAAGVDTPEFGQGLADRVTWMVDNNLNGARLQVNPPQLGPIEVRIAVQGDHAQVWLTSHSAVTRDALQSSSPKLREMLGAQGFGQVSVDISQRSYQERSTYQQPYDFTPSAARSTSAAGVSSASTPAPRASSGAVDAYA